MRVELAPFRIAKAVAQRPFPEWFGQGQTRAISARIYRLVTLHGAGFATPSK